MICHRWPVFAIGAACCAFVVPAQAEATSFENVLSAVTLDFTGDGQLDRAVLVQNKDDGADLYLYFSKDDSTAESAASHAETKKGVAFSGRVWGQLPSLGVNDKGSLMIKSGNESIGRNRWTQTLTVVYRRKEFLIGGIAYTTRDTLDPGAEAHAILTFCRAKVCATASPSK